MLTTTLFFLLSITHPFACLAALDLHLFSEHPCGDSTPSGVYSSPERSVEGIDHVIVFQGGGACFSDEDCLSKMKKTPNKFSSKNYPARIKGATILSDDAAENVDNLEEAAKWFVPYCTQDGYLGAGIYDGGGLERTGSLQVKQVIRHWASTVNKPRRLVVVGISIGAMGVLNHFDELQNTAIEAGVGEVQIILDSGILSSQDLGLSLKAGTSSYIRSISSNVTHPLCYEKDIYTSLDDDGLIPCCLSLTCMLAHKHNLMGNGTDMLLINSLYDPLELSYILNPEAEDEDELMESGYRTTSDITDASEKLGLSIDVLWKAGETGGQRKYMIEQTLHYEKIRWVSTSCVMHTFLDPAPELEFLLRCEDVVLANHAEIGEIVCKDDGAIGVNFANFYDLHMILWGSTQRWKIATTNGIPLRSLVNEFLLNYQGLSLSHEFETCHGPNCVDIHRRTDPNQCMDLIETNDLNKDIPIIVQGLGMALFAIMSVIGIVFRYRKTVAFSLNAGTKPSTNNGEEEEDRSINIGPMSIYVKPLKPKCSPRIKTKTDDSSLTNTDISKVSLPLIHGVLFSLPRGAITALTGRSGSGKSTILSAVIQQANRNLEVYSKQNLLHDFKVVYLRQDARCEGLSQITAEQFLHSNAVMYKATGSRFRMLIKFIERFKDTPIGSLSGGQIRRLEMCSSLLLEPDILVLDEPLSGLDSVSIESVFDMLKRVAIQDNIGVLVTIHQPSTDTLLNHFSKFIALEDGKLVCNAMVSNLWGGENACHKYNAGEEVHELLQGNSSCRLRGIVEEIEKSNTKSQFSKEYILARKAANNASLIRQCIAIAQRLHLDRGISVGDIIRLPAVMSVLALVFRFDTGSLTQILFAVACFIAVPVNVMRYMISDHCKYWIMHRNDITDHRISVHSFIWGTQLYQFAIPTVMMLVSLALGYAILGWTFKTLIVQFLFSNIYLLVSSQLGRALGTHYDGDYSKFSRVYSLFITMSFFFGGTLVSVRKLPWWTPWIISPNFWATSGAMLEHLHHGNGFGQQPCTSLISCLLSDPDVVAVYRGYSPIATTLSSICILFALFLLLCVAEFIATRRRISRFAVMKTSVPPQQSHLFSLQTRQVQVELIRRASMNKLMSMNRSRRESMKQFASMNRRFTTICDFELEDEETSSAGRDR